MGVRHLLSYINNSVPNGVVDIDIAQETIKYRRKYGRNPTIILDVLTLQDLVYTNDHEICLGGRYNVYNDRAYEMFSKLKSLRIQLIFFIDGPPQDDKMSTCLDRRNNSYDNAFKILKHIDSGKDLTKAITGVQIPNLLPFFPNFTYIASQFGDIHVATLNECDLELANLANDIGAMAIISNDTDFLIYEGDWRFWSSKHINFQTLRTVEYNRHALRTHLSLNSNQMSLFATLGGNDILKYDYVRGFHRRSNQNGDKFIGIAAIIRNLRSYPPFLNNQDIQYLARLIFTPAGQEQGINLIKQSLKSYNYTGIQKSSDDPTVDLISKDINRFNYVILGNRPYIIQLFYFDLTDNQFSSFYDLIFPSIRRQMGILLTNNPGESSRTFYCKKSHQEPYTPFVLQPEYPKRKIPLVGQLLFLPYGANGEIDNLRLELICWQISEKLHPELLLSIPKEMLIQVLILFFLYEKKQITLDEADCLLLSVNCPSNIRNNLKYEDINVINGRDARIAFLFGRMHFFITNCFNVVGLKQFGSLLTYDGLYFHHIRKNWEQKNDVFRQALEPLKHLRIYSEISQSEN